MSESTDTYTESFGRNLGILSPAEQDRLRQATVSIVGLGGIGGNVLIQLARTGVGKFRLADFDRFDLPNINRQYGATVNTKGRLKCEVLAEEVLQINPTAKVEIFPEGFTEESANGILNGCDMAVDAIDFYGIEAHLAFHCRAREHGVFILMGSPVGFSACLQVFDPNGMSLEEYCDIRPEMSAIEKQLRYACGLVPELLHIDYFDVSLGASNTDFLKRTGPSIATACGLAASLVATEAVLLILGRREPRVIPRTFQFDPYTFRYAKTFVPGGMGDFDPGPAIKSAKDKSSFVPQVFELLYRKKKAVKAKINGTELYYRTEGEGPPVLLISPLGADSTFWSRQTEVLARHFKVITFDSRGSGESSSCGDDCSTELMADDSIGLLSNLNIDRAHIIGLALGGLIAQKMALKRPSLVDRLVLVSNYSAADRRIRDVTAEWRQLAQSQGMEKLFDTCLPWLFSSAYVEQHAGEIDKLKAFYRLTLQRPTDFCQQSLAGVRHDSQKLLSQITCRVLVIHGQDDKLVDARHGQALAEQLPNARFCLLEKAPHFLIWENAEVFNAETVRFLTEN